jgi:hypothetical protein
LEAPEIAKKIDMQRRALDIELLQDNYVNQSNLAIFAICQEDLGRATPTKQYRCDEFRTKLRNYKHSMRTIPLINHLN